MQAIIAKLNELSDIGVHLHAVFSQGRVTWDTKGLDRFALSHPEVVKFRKQGTPSVALRIVKD